MWLFTGKPVDVTAPGCSGCKELYDAVMRGEVKIPGADKIRKALERLGSLEPGLYAPDIEIIAEYDEHGNMIIKDIKVRGVKVFTPNGEVRYIKIED